MRILEELVEAVIAKRISIDQAGALAKDSAARLLISVEDADQANDRARAVLAGGNSIFAIVWATLALAVAQRLNAMVAEAHALATIGSAARAQKQYALASQALIDAERTFDRLGPDWREGSARCVATLAQVRMDENRWTEAIQLLTHAKDAFAELELAEMVALCQRTLADLYQREGRLSEAADLFMEAARIYAGLDMKSDVATCQRMTAGIRPSEDRLSEAADLLTDAGRLYAEVGMNRDAAACQYIAALQRVKEDRFSEAAGLLAQAQQVFAELQLSKPLAQCLYTLADVYIKQDRLREAGDLLTRAQPIFAELRMTKEVADCQYSLAIVCREERRPSEAADLLTQAQQVYSELGLSKPLAQCLYTLAQVWINERRLGDAGDLLTRAQPIFAELGMTKEVADCDYCMAEVCRTLERPSEAADLLTRAQQMYGDIESTEYVARCQYTLAEIRITQNRLDEAADLLVRAHEVFVQLRLAEFVPLCCYTLAQLRIEQGRLNEAADLLTQAQAQPVPAETGSRGHVARCQYTLAQLRIEEGRLSEAAELLVKAEQVFVELEEIESIANCWYTLADLRTSEGRLGEAAGLLVKSQPVYVELALTARVAGCQYALAQVRREQGRPNDAADLLGRAQQVYAGLGMSKEVADCEYTLAEMSLDEGRPSEAEELLTRAKPVYAELGSTQALARCEYTLARVRMHQGQLSGAADLMTRAQQIYAELGLTHEVARCQYMVARIRMQQAGTPGADRTALLSAAATALHAARAANQLGEVPADWRIGWLVPAQLSQIAQALGSRDSALNWLDEAIAVLEQVRLTRPLASDRVLLGGEGFKAYLVAARTALELQQTERAYRYVLAGKGREALEAAGRNTADSLLAQLEPTEQTRLQQLLAEQHALESALLGPDLGPLGIALGTRPDAPQTSMPPEQRRTLANDVASRLSATRRTTAAFVAELIDRGLLPEGTPGGPLPSLATLQRALPPGGVLLDLFVDESAGAAALFLVRAATGELTQNAPIEFLDTVMLDGRRVVQILRELRAWTLPSPSEPAAAQCAARSLPSFTERLADLGAALFGDPRVSAALQQAATILISPPSARDVLPWQALPWFLPSTPGGSRPRVARLALGHNGQSRPFAVLPSGALQTLLVGRASPTRPSRGVRVVAANTRPPIPWTALEARLIANLYAPDIDGQQDPDQPGSYEALMAEPTWPESESRYLALHISCHGSHLSLMLIDQSGEVHRLQVEEILGHLRIRADLVVLSTCWSAMPGSHAGAEWLGLGMGFLGAAGARALVVCLWPVLDEAAPFYFRAMHGSWLRDGLPIGIAVEHARTALANISTLDRAAASADLVGLTANKDRGLRHRYRGRGDTGESDESYERFDTPDQTEVYLLMGDPTLTAAR